MSKTGSYSGGSTVIHTGRPRAAYTRAAKRREEQKEKDKQRLEAGLIKYQYLKSKGPQTLPADEVPPRHNSKVVKKRKPLARKQNERTQKLAKAENRKTFFKQVKDWGRVWDNANLKNNNPPFPSQKIFTYINKKEAEVVALLNNQGPVRISHKTRKRIIEILKISFCISSASSFVENKATFAIPDILQSTMSNAELKGLKSGLESNYFYISSLKKYERRKKAADKTKQAQRQKMANVVVEKKKPLSQEMKKFLTDEASKNQEIRHQKKGGKKKLPNNGKPGKKPQKGSNKFQTAKELMELSAKSSTNLELLIHIGVEAGLKRSAAEQIAKKIRIKLYG